MRAQKNWVAVATSSGEGMFTARAKITNYFTYYEVRRRSGVFRLGDSDRVYIMKLGGDFFATAPLPLPTPLFLPGRAVLLGMPSSVTGMGYDLNTCAY